MQIIIPMAGAGRRFQEAGYRLPKYLIEVDGKRIIKHVIDLFPGEKNFLFIVDRGQLQKHRLRSLLLRFKPEAAVVAIDPPATGVVPTVLLANRLINNRQPVIVCYCDFNLHWDYHHFKKTVTQTRIAGSIVCYRGFHPHLLGRDLYAGVRTDRRGTVREVREKHSFTKNKMNTWQSAGLYYVASGVLLKKYAQQLVDRKLHHDNGEYYVSQMYNLLVHDALPVAVYPVSYFCQWGTPTELHNYLRWTTAIDRDNDHLYDERILKYWKEYRKASDSYD